MSFSVRHKTIATLKGVPKMITCMVAWEMTCCEDSAEETTSKAMQGTMRSMAETRAISFSVSRVWTILMEESEPIR